ncbi:DUF995 domain-containing protein [Mesorhizobium sp. M00.F.Ca.ET.216.01.1.1]|uniref:DUF995 domain-containing protein n=1 Tax=Mesorhizobium sp. M00.F.Ca.ET.216.01.1.1 TaxID=2500528 RepID=UPI000FD95FFF|nr:DUF995 domain-containing protein [Mesorhizobium sp. M00.F.Ca.ET.216.01.1.1]TGQ38325.1 DUF995 domain-containing protein [Mesorhizobium sp. M00.F.Ca.ET.216.01.1.1]TJW11859.1 MAG: DUF995 domain-containing protein [Mesorhizobium sp.]
MMEKSPIANWETRTAAALRGCLLATSCMLAVCAFETPAEAGGKHSVAPADARAMTGAELYILYHDKSWLWPNGAGRMHTDGRRFTAWAGSGEKSTWAEGRWLVTNRGRLCLKAQWHSSSGIVSNKTCFSHKKLGDTVYQKREPSGAWYVFKHGAAADNDEFNKLVSQDLVSSNLERIKSELEPARQLSDANLSTQQ